MVGQTKAFVSGIACRFPKSANVKEFWENLINGVDMLDDNQWPAGLYDLPPRTGHIPDIDKFDANFFKIPENEAIHLSLVCRLFLEVIHECIVDSGLTLADLQANKTGLYLACTFSDVDEVTSSFMADSSWLNVKSEIISQISQMFGLDGPVISIDTACSSSFAALDVAISDLITRRCKYAIVAGINLVINPSVSLRFHRLRMLSPTGDSKVYDASANGYVRSDGIGAILLSCSESACRRIYASLVDIAVNCDGYKEEGIVFPSRTSQASLLESIYSRNCIENNDIAYIEMHGTGTQIGDLIETCSLADVLCKARDEPLLVGSVKSNMGHCEAASGLAGLIKCILSMHHGVLPACLHYTTPNPDILPINNGQVCVVAASRPLPDGIIGVSSFGFGGVNGHALLQPYRSKIPEKDLVPVLIPVTVRNESSFNKISDFVHNHRHDERLLHFITKSLLSCDPNQPMRGFIHLSPQTIKLMTSKFCYVEEQPGKLWLILNDVAWSSGGINKEMLSLSVFAKSLATSDKIIQEFTGGQSVLKNSDVKRSSLSKLGLLRQTVCLIGMMDVFLASNVHVSGIMACGLSEIASAYMTGCLTLNQCLQVAATVGEYLENFDDCVKTYLINMSADEAYSFSPLVKVLAVLQTSVVLAVRSQNAERILGMLKQKGFLVSDLNAMVPLYSSLMGNMDTLKQNLKIIIKSPKKISPRLISASSHILQPRVSLHGDQCDAEYFCLLLNHSYNWKRALSHLPSSVVLITLSMDQSATSCKMQYATGISKSHLTGDGSNQPEKLCDRRPSQLNASEVDDKKGNKMKKMDRKGSVTLSVLEEVRTRRPSQTWNVVDRLCDKPVDQHHMYELGGLDDGAHNGVLHCYPERELVLAVIAELHLLGHKINVSHLFKTSAILDCSAPPISPLVDWDHSHSYPTVDWTYFCCQVKDDEVDLYHVPAVDEGDLCDPLTLALFHTCSAISYKLSEKKETLAAITLCNLRVNSDLLTPRTIEDACIEIHMGRKQFCVSSGDGIVLAGSYELPSTEIDLPTIPGYDIDINDNLQNSSVYCEVETTEILWEDSWLEFLNATLEFAEKHIKWPLVKVMIDPKQHLEVAKKCASILTMVDTITGLCKAGCLVLQFKSDIPASLNQSALQMDISSATLNEDVMVSVIVTIALNPQSSAPNRVMLYLGSKTSNLNDKLMGILTVIDNSFSFCDIPLDVPLQLSDLETMVPYILAAYIMFDVAKATEKTSIIVLPPLDTVAIYVIALADQLGCAIYSASWDAEIRQDLDMIFPNVRNLSADNLVAKLRRLTLGLGCDICIKNSGTDMNGVVDLVAVDGMIIQTVPSSKADNVMMNIFLKNITVAAIDPVLAFITMMEKSADDMKALLYNVMSDAMKKLMNEGYPERKGFLYNMIELWSLTQPIKLQSLLHILDKPGLNVRDVLDGLTESDMCALQKIQESFLQNPQESSTSHADQIDTFNTSALCSSVNLPKSRTSSTDLPPLEQLLGADPQNALLSTPIVTITIPDIFKKPLKIMKCPKFVLKPAAKPEQDVGYTSNDATVESKPEDRTTQSPRMNILNVAESAESQKQESSIEIENPNPFVTPVCSRRQLELDLLFVGPPRTPMTPALKKVMTPSRREPTLVRLNNLATQSCLYMIHPVTGVLTLLQPVGAKLNITCIGVQKTVDTPRTSIRDIANFYRSCIEQENPHGPYNILGYSLGGMIAFELAKQLQDSNKTVEHLIMLDGSPEWAHGQTNRIREIHVPVGTPENMVQNLLEVGSIMWYLELSGPIPHRQMVQQSLEQMPNLRARAAMAVDFLMGNILISPNPRKSKWLAVKNKLQQKKNEFNLTKNGLFNSAQEVIRLSRERKAIETNEVRQFVENYKVKDKFDDLCWMCQKNNSSIYKSANLPNEEKSERLKQQETHLHQFTLERSLYQDMVQKAKNVVSDVKVKLGTNAPASKEMTMHYSFDYAQQVHFPSDPMQPGPMYFLTPRKCGLFGVACEGIPQQVNYLIDECMCITKGSNAVVSYLDHFFDKFGLGETAVELHCDNCSGQNKNNYMLWYLAWRVFNGLHKSVSLNFLVAGHTKFAPDWCFGLVKQNYRRNMVSCLDNIVTVVNTSTVTGVNIAQLVGRENGDIMVPQYDWQTFLKPHFRVFPGLKQFHHFRFDSTQPGVVFAKEYADSVEIMETLLSGVPPRAKPLSVIPPGLDQKRQQYLYDKIREFCTPSTMNIACPVPSVVTSNYPIIPLAEVVVNAAPTGMGRGRTAKRGRKRQHVD